MPLGFERINERASRPNPLINFIKPLPGATSTTAQDFLERIAAQCYPVMKNNYIAVMALEEYEWNPEFIGRNFNAGEVIQLVLRSRSGAWLPFKYVQMTMMHELAHCKQMNHSGAFWKVRNAYAGEMRELWAKAYSGEGLWGRGRGLESGRFMHNVMPDAADLPEHTCGGTYRRRGRKRKRGGAAKDQSGKTTLSYAERKQRRIRKKFGDPDKAVTLGTDEEARVKLEDGKRPKGKPRVAGSNRGRELRAAAALARFEQQVKREPEVKQEADTESDTEDEFDWPLTDDDEAAIQRGGKDFVRICDAEDEEDEDVKREMDELKDLYSIPPAGPTKRPSNPLSGSQAARSRAASASTVPALDGSDTDSNLKLSTAKPPPPKLENSETESDSKLESARSRSKASTSKRADLFVTGTTTSSICAACSFVGDSAALICMACSNVLKPAQMPNHWRCPSHACQGSVYINARDYGRCQVCGTAKP